MRKALVIGGGGFIGSHLTRYLCEHDWKVNVIDRAPSDEFLQICSPFLKSANVDLHEDQELESKVRESSVIFHLAGQPSVQACENDPAGSARDNFETTFKIIEALRQVAEDRQSRMLVFTSTCAVYGDPQMRSPISEGAVTSPLSNYGKDKLRSETAIFEAASSGLFSCCALRLFNVYGPGQKRNSPYSGVITRFLDALATGRALEIYGTGQQVRDFIHVNDVVHALCLAAESQGFEAPLNMATGIGTTINELAELFIRSKPIAVRRLAPRESDIFFSVGDISKMRSFLKWSPTVLVQQGIQQLIDGAPQLKVGPLR